MKINCMQCGKPIAVSSNGDVEFHNAPVDHESRGYKDECLASQKKLSDNPDQPKQTCPECGELNVPVMTTGKLFPHYVGDGAELCDNSSHTFPITPSLLSSGPGAKGWDFFDPTRTARVRQTTRRTV